MVIYYLKNKETPEEIRFAIGILKKTLKQKDIFCSEERLNFFTENEGERRIVISPVKDNIVKKQYSLEAEGFEIYLSGNTIHIIGADPAGTMYGILDTAEAIKYSGLDSVKSKVENPFMKKRGIKFNLPYQPYAEGDPFVKNADICMDMDFWRDYIDFLAMNRYNCLSLWSENPFHMMFRLDKYPMTTPYTDVELERFKSVYRFIFRHAKERGIETYIITWNMRITPDIAKGLGLPAEMGYYPHDTKMIDMRQHQDIIKDYFREAVKTLIMTYPDLTGLGTSNSEELAGTPEETEQWVVDTYLKAIHELGYNIPFIHRTNMSSGKVAKTMFLDNYASDRKYISWKYSNAHMYSHPLPQFEKLWGAWDGIDINDVKVIYTVRNDDFHTLRGGDPEFISQYIKGMKKPYVDGFYWGADGYLWAGEFQHIPNKHIEWKYDFEKQWLQFETLGRLGYNPELNASIWLEKSRERYGRVYGENIFKGLQAGTRIICAVNRLFWIDYDFQWHPESLLSAFGFKTVVDFMNGHPMPGSGTISIREYADNMLKGSQCTGESPADVIEIIRSCLSMLDDCIKSIESEAPRESLRGELHCTLLDIKAWRELGRYYLYKFQAALDLVLFEKTGEMRYGENAVGYLENALTAWRGLSEIGSSHYIPYYMPRVKHIFGWSYYTDEVEKDIILAKQVKPAGE